MNKISIVDAFYKVVVELDNGNVNKANEIMNIIGKHLNDSKKKLEYAKFLDLTEEEYLYFK